jgi:osmotically-inducible protein OsmY
MMQLGCSWSRKLSLWRVAASVAVHREEMTLSSVINRAWCAGLAAAVLSSAVGCSAFPHRTEAQKQADHATATRVETALDEDSLLFAKHITVRAEDGVVRLGGYVWDSNDIYEAQRIAERVEGVVKVVNDLELQRNGIDDSSIVR